MKNSICKSGFTIIILFIFLSLFSQEDTQYMADSLSAKMKSMTGKPKLEALAKLAQSEAYSDNLIPIVNNLEREATKRQDSRFLLCSYNYKITYYLRSYNHDSISKYIKLSAPIQRKLDPTDDFVARNELLKNIVYTERGLFDLALINQKRYLERVENIKDVEPKILQAVYIGFGDIYYHQEQYEEALKYFNQAKGLSQKIDPNPISYISTLCSIALCEVNLGNYAIAVQYCDSVICIINENEENITEESRISLNAFTNLIAIQAYSKLKNFNKAKVLIEQLLANLDSPIYQEPEAYCYHSLYVYYSEIHQYDEALKYTKIGIKHLKKNNKTLGLPAFIKEKALLYYNKQNYKEAFDELLYFTQLTDSIPDKQNAIQLDELAVMYDVNLKNAEIARTNTQLKLTRTINIALIVGFILLLSLLLVIRTNSKKQKAKSKTLFKQQEELNKSINYYKKNYN